jgi:cellulose synthase/poly-beta-1,6-N-acetylglucosamine synthase-like glycosyltransferase
MLPALLGALLCVLAGFGVRTTIGVATLGLQAFFLAFFVRHLAFVVVAVRAGVSDQQAPGPGPDLGGNAPRLSVLVACHNEERVLDRLLGALGALRYPADRLQLVLVDDNSSDRTGELLDRWAAAEPRHTVLHRPAGSTGGKSGALNTALAHVTGEVVVVFDADHRPRPDVLLRLARHFADPGTGAVQGRCRILNGDESLVSELVEIDYLGGYLVNEYGRQAVYALPAYGGACCAVRTASLRAVHGWNENTVTEDTDLTLRLLLAGQRVRYDVTAVDEEEAVVTVRRYWTQRYRWARGHQQAWREFRSAVWHSRRLSVLEKIETTMFLLTFHLPVVAAAGVGLLLTGVVGVGGILDEVSAVLWTLLLLGPMLELSTGLLLAGAPRRKAWILVFFLPLFAVSMALCTKAWVDGIIGRRYTWAKTVRSGDGPAPLAEVGS